MVVTGPSDQPGLGTLIKRGAKKRCPSCGRGRVFRSWFHMLPVCDDCGYSYEREEGYWVGALIMNIAVAEACFAVLFAAVVLATMPDVAWAPLLGVALFTNALLPTVFYPYSKTLWMAVDLYLHPLVGRARLRS
jgi:uncharacterized protein (DUF983 family)